MFVGLSSAVWAQAPNLDQQQQQRLRAWDVIVAQRNQAMDGVGICIGELQAQVEALKKQLEEAKKAACEKP